MATDEMHSAEVRGQEEWRMHGAQKERKNRNGGERHLARQTDSRNRCTLLFRQSQVSTLNFQVCRKLGLHAFCHSTPHTLHKASKLGDTRTRQRIVIGSKTDRNTILESLSHSHSHAVLAIDPWTWCEDLISLFWWRNKKSDAV